MNVTVAWMFLWALVTVPLVYLTTFGVIVYNNGVVGIILCIAAGLFGAMVIDTARTK